MSSLEQLTTWLNSVYALELSLVQNLETQIKSAADRLDVRPRLEQHLTETRRHVERVRECLGILGAKPSAAKAVLGSVVGMVQGTSTGMFHDALMKNTIADYAMEHFEIACYRALIAAAEDLGEPEIARLCRETLSEEEAMAQWLEDQVPKVTRHTLRELAHT